MFFVKHKIFFLGLSGVVTLIGIVLWVVFGLPYGIDFTGGSLMEVKFAQTPPAQEKIREALMPLHLGDVSVQTTGNNGLIVRSKDVNEETHQQMLSALRSLDRGTGANISNDGDQKNPGKQLEVQAVDAQGKPASLGIDAIGVEAVPTAGASSFEELRFESIGPAIGAELKSKAQIAVVLAILAIVIYVAWAFRHVSKPVASWKYGVITIIALAHDIILPIGIFALLGSFGKAEIGAAFVAALLTILGYSVNDTIVVFDRIRENLLKDRGETFAETVGMSLNQTIVRSLNTTVTTLLALIAVFFFGGDTVKMFALALIIGIASGAYSSIFIASPLLVVVEEWQRRRS